MRVRSCLIADEKVNLHSGAAHPDSDSWRGARGWPVRLLPISSGTDGGVCTAGELTSIRVRRCSMRNSGGGARGGLPFTVSKAYVRLAVV
jgi:hypothetical protein